MAMTTSFRSPGGVRDSAGFAARNGDDSFRAALERAIDYFGPDWYRRAPSFYNYINDLCPERTKELALIRLFFRIRPDDEKFDGKKDLNRLIRLGRAEPADAVLFISDLSAAAGFYSGSFQTEKTKALDKILSVPDAVERFRQYAAADGKDARAPKEYLYGFSVLIRMDREQKENSGGSFSVQPRLIYDYGINREDAKTLERIYAAFCEKRFSDDSDISRKGLVTGIAIAAACLLVVLGIVFLIRNIQGGSISRTEEADAVSILVSNAEAGDPEAQNDLGYCYQHGEGVETDLEEAVKWYKLAAEAGNAEARNNLGYCYQYGEGVETDLEEAVKWYKLAAEAGNAEARNNLGYCCQFGVGVEIDEQEAVKWYRLAAEQGQAEARNNLGYCYQYGVGVEIDEQEAVKWYKLAAEQDNNFAQNNLGYCYQYGVGVETDLEEAVKWYELAAEQGMEDAQIALERILEESDETKGGGE